MAPPETAVTAPITEDQRPETAAKRVVRQERHAPKKRRAAGRDLRASAPRSSHGEWTAPANRPDPVALLEQQASDRVPDLVPIRYERMLDSPLHSCAVRRS